MPDLATLALADLEPYLGQTVSLHFHNGPELEAVLKSVTAVPSATAPGSLREAFTAIFTVAPPCNLLAGTADIVHAGFGTLAGVLLERTVPDTIAARDAFFKLVLN